MWPNALTLAQRCTLYLDFHFSRLGVGIGITTVQLPVILFEHFGDQRAAAVGVSYAGATLGAFVFPIFFNWLLQHFTLWSALLLMSAIQCNALPAVYMLKSHRNSNGGSRRCAKSVSAYEPVPSFDEHGDVMDEHASERSITTVSPSRDHGNSIGHHNNRGGRNDEYANEKAAANPVANESRIVMEVVASVLEVARKMDAVGKSPVSSGRSKCCDSSMSAVPSAAERISHDTDTRRFVHNDAFDNEKVDAYAKDASIESPMMNTTPIDVGSVGRRRSSLLNEVNRERTTPLIKEKCCDEQVRPLADETSCPIATGMSWRRTLADHVRTDARLLCSPYFALISFTYICFIVCNVTLLLILVDYATDCGVHEHRAVLLLSMYSVTDLCGRLLPGWLSYGKIASNKTLYITSIGALGALFFAFPLSHASKPAPDTSFQILLALTLASGFVAGCQMILPPVIIG